METGLFEIQADHLSGFREARRPRPLSQDVVYAPFGRNDVGFLDYDSSGGILNQMESAPPYRKLLILPSPILNSRGAFYVSPICPTTRLTALAAMKQSFGGRSVKSWLRSMHWTAANHRIEDAGFRPAPGKICWLMSLRNDGSRPLPLGTRNDL